MQIARKQNSPTKIPSHHPTSTAFDHIKTHTSLFPHSPNSQKMERTWIFSKEDAKLQHPFLFLLILVLSVLIMDPFHMSPVGNHDFRPMRYDIAPYSEVMKTWPRDKLSRLGNGKLQFANEVYGPESLEFDVHGRGPYAGLADGRIVRWMGEHVGWETFATVTRNWSEELCAKGAYSTTKRQWKVESLCGRPLGIRFNRDSGDLYIADAYHGLLVVGPHGGLAVPLTNQADGTTVFFANDLDIHANGSVFFTDTSQRYNRMDHFFILLEGEATGRLLRYDPPSRTTHVVLDGLAFPNGVQLSADQSFLLFTETTSCRVKKLWLENRKVEIVANLPGFPDNVRRNDRGEFWIAIDCCRTREQEVLNKNPWMRSLYFRLPIPMSVLARGMGMKMFTMISLLDENGKILEVLEDRKGAVMTLVSEVQEREGKLWIGTVAHNHITSLEYPLTQNLSRSC